MTVTSLDRVNKLLKYYTVMEAICKHPMGITLRQIDTIDPGIASMYGIYSSGDRQVDEIAENTLVTVKYPTGKIAEFFDLGMELYIDRNDIAVVYELIARYLTQWERTLGNLNHKAIHSRYIDGETGENIRKLHALADRIYPDAIAKLRYEGKELEFSSSPKETLGWIGMAERSMSRMGMKKRNSNSNPLGGGTELNDVDELLRTLAKTNSIL